jgi:hypothetical protein
VVAQRWPAWPTFDFYLVNDEEAGTYRAFLGNTEWVMLTYSVIDESRLLLLAISLPPEFTRPRTMTEPIRNVVDELIARVLDDIRETGKKITVICPVVGEFLARNPRYLDLTDEVR